MKRLHTICTNTPKTSNASVEDFVLSITTKFSEYIAHGAYNAFQLKSTLLLKQATLIN